MTPLLLGAGVVGRGRGWRVPGALPGVLPGGTRRLRYLASSVGSSLKLKLKFILGVLSSSEVETPEGSGVADLVVTAPLQRFGADLLLFFPSEKARASCCQWET